MRRLLFGLFVLAFGCSAQPDVDYSALAVFAEPTPEPVRLQGFDTLVIGDSMPLFSGEQADRITQAGAFTADLTALVATQEIGTYPRIIVWAGTAACIRGEQPKHVVANIRTLADYGHAHSTHVALLSPVRPNATSEFAAVDCGPCIAAVLAAFPEMIDVSDWPTRYPDLFYDGLHTTEPVWEQAIAQQ